MSRYQIIQATPAHLKALSLHMRDGDRCECESAGLPAVRALWQSWRASHIRLAGIVDGEVAVVGGCTGTTLGPEGCPWMLTSPAIERVPLAFLREVRSEVRGMLDVHPVLRNYVRAAYTRAVRFLDLVGFEVGDIVPYGPLREPFHEFTMER